MKYFVTFVCIVFLFSCSTTEPKLAARNLLKGTWTVTFNHKPNEEFLYFITSVSDTHITIGNDTYKGIFNNSTFKGSLLEQEDSHQMKYTIEFTLKSEDEILGLLTSQMTTFATNPEGIKLPLSYDTLIGKRSDQEFEE